MDRLGVALLALAGLAAGAAVLVLGKPGLAEDIWALTTLGVLAPLSVSVIRSLARGDVGVDAIALVAMAVSLALSEQLAGAVIAVMLAGGNALEAVAGRRATRDLRALLDRAPRHAHVVREGSVVDVAVDAVRAGDRLVVRAG